MSRWISNDALTHLRDVSEWPDLGERYRVEGRLGHGGMGVVYAARDVVLDRAVAIKVLGAAEVSSESARRLEIEARILARLEHPGVVPVHDSGRLADGRVFYVMKKVRGLRLDVAIAEPQALNQRLDLFLRICDTVAFAHARGVVHRDLKPENVMVGEFGEVLVMDWGVAKLMSAPAPDGAIVGTPGFMAPEQVHDAASVDGRADVFALGVILEALTPASLPAPLAAIAHHARAEHPDDRYPDVPALAADVARFRDGEPVSIFPESAMQRLSRFYGRYRVPIWLLVVYLTVRAVVLVWFGT